MNVKIKLLSEFAVIPQKQTAGAIAYDVYLPKETTINVGRQIIPLDFSIELPNGIEAKIEPRSGFSAKGIQGQSMSYFDITTRFNADVIVGKIDAKLN